jgi:CBS domain-containing protein
MKIRDLLKIKGRPVITIRPTETVAAAIQKLAEYDRGSIPVCNEKGELVGIITERDIVRKCFVPMDTLASVRIEDVMTKGVAIGAPEDDLDYAISVMKQKRIRHLPIIDQQQVVGMISMRDLLDVQLSETKAEIRYAGLLSRPPRRPVV